MRTDQLKGTKTQTKKATWHKRWNKVIISLAAVAVFCTTYALILPAITMSTDVFCGMEEHEHTEACYERQLICGLEENAAETKTESVLVDAGHIHDDSCYTVESVLICENTEEGHEHSEACYEEVKTLTCGQEEREAVYEEKEVAVEGGHVHTEACYDSKLICEKEEHKHVEMCYSNKEADLETASVWEKTLPKKEEMKDDWKEDTLLIAKSQLGYHESEANYVIEDSERKGYNRYGEMFGIPYGDWCAMFLQFSLHYAGVDERAMKGSPAVPTWVKMEEKHDNFYKADDEDYEPKATDIIFFNWDEDDSADHVGIIEEIKKDEDGKITEIITIEGNSSNQVKKNTYKPDDENIYGYSEIPDKMTEEELKKLEEEDEANAEEQVEDAENQEAEEAVAEETEATEVENTNKKVYEGVDGTLIVDEADYTITVSYTADAGVPANANLRVTEILQDDDAYSVYNDKAAEEVYGRVETLPYARFFDITILDEEGNEVQPTSTVSVVIDLKDNTLNTPDVEFAALHFVDESKNAASSASVSETEITETEAVDNISNAAPETAEIAQGSQSAQTAVNSETLTAATMDISTDEVVAFDTDGFSVYGVVMYYTVDFYYTKSSSHPIGSIFEIISNKIHDAAQEEPVEVEYTEYHMPGGTEMLMSELFEYLEIERNAADIVNVEFTNNELVAFQSMGNDYKIISLQPFSTYEKVTITFDNGDVVVIDVTDEQETNVISIDSWAQLEEHIYGKNGRTRVTNATFRFNYPLAASSTINIASDQDITIEGANIYRADGATFTNGGYFTGDAGSKLTVKNSYISGKVYNGGAGADFTWTTDNTNVRSRGLFIGSAGTVIIDNTTLENITATANGSALYNTAPVRSAGTLYIQNGSKIQNINITESGSSGTVYGGVLSTGTVYILDSSITDNTSSIGTVGLIGATAEINNSSISKNVNTASNAAPVRATNNATVEIKGNTKINNNRQRYPNADNTPVVNGYDNLYKELGHLSYTNNIEQNDSTRFRYSSRYFFGRAHFTTGSGAGDAEGYQNRHNLANTAGALLVDGSTVTMSGNAELKENLGDAGAVLIRNNGVFTQESGHIDKNRGYHAGAVSIVSGEYNLNNGSVDGNKTIWFGAVNVSCDNATFNMNGGHINLNTTLHKGGAVYINSNNANLKAGEIANNTALVFGGGVYLENNHKTILDDAAIYDNLASIPSAPQGERAYTESNGKTSYAAFRGGGFWSCSTGTTYYNANAVAIYANDTAIGKKTATNNEAYGPGADFFANGIGNNKEKLQFIANEDNETDKWLDENNNRTHVETQTDMRVINQTVALDNDKGKTDYTAENYALRIHDNTAINGGGLASNGRLYLMEESTSSKYKLSFTKKYDGNEWNDVRIKIVFRKGTEVIHESIFKEITSANKNKAVEFVLPEVTYRNRKINASPDKEKYEQSQAYSKLYNMPLNVGMNYITGTEYSIEVIEEAKMNGTWKSVADDETPYTAEVSNIEKNIVSNDNTSEAEVIHKQEFVAKSSINNHGEEVKDRLVIRKVDENNNPLQGASFSLWSFDGQNWDDKIVRSDNDTTFTISLAAFSAGERGKNYYIAEDGVPQGYNGLSKVIAFKIEQDKFTQITLVDEPSNAHYNGNRFKRGTSEHSGSAHVYYESDTNSRYKRSDDYTHVLPSNPQDLENAGAEWVRAANSVQVTVKNTPNDIVIEKVSEQGDALQGAEFILITTEDLSSKGSYVNVFGKANPTQSEPNGYGATYLHFPTSKFVYNNFYQVSDSAVRKIDDHGFYVEKATGAKLTDANGNYIRYLTDRIITEDEDYRSVSFTTGSNGKVSIGALPAGTYKIIETVAPEGYELPESLEDRSITITVDANGRITSASGNTGSINASPEVVNAGNVDTVTIKNKQVKGDFSITKEVLPAEGASVTVYSKDNIFWFDVKIKDKNNNDISNAKYQIIKSDGSVESGAVSGHPAADAQGNRSAAGFFSSGQYLVPLKAGQKIKFVEIPEGAKYDVKESPKVTINGTEKWMDSSNTANKAEEYIHVKHQLINGEDISDIDANPYNGKWYSGEITEETNHYTVKAINREVTNTFSLRKELVKGGAGNNALYANDDTLYEFVGTITKADGSGFSTAVNGVTFSVLDKNGHVIETELPGFTIKTGETYNGVAVPANTVPNEIRDVDTPNGTISVGNGIRRTHWLGAYGDTGDKTKNPQHEMHFFLKAGQTLVVNNLPIGAQWEIKEVLGDNADKYDVSYFNGTVPLTPNNGYVGGTTNSNSPDGVTIVAKNTEKPGKIEIKKLVEGASTEEIATQDFTFNVVVGDKTQTVTVKGDGTPVEIANLPIGETWTIKEVNVPNGYKLKGYKVDGVDVTAIATGEITGTVKAEGSKTEVVATNERQKVEADLELNFVKEFMGNSEHNPAKDVAIVVELKNGSNVIVGTPDGTNKVTIDGKEAALITAGSGDTAKIKFDKITYKKGEATPAQVEAYRSVCDLTTFGVGEEIALASPSNWTIKVTEYVRDSATSNWVAATERYTATVARDGEAASTISDKDDLTQSTYTDSYVVNEKLQNSKETYELEVDKVDETGAAIDGAKFVLRLADTRTNNQSIPLRGNDGTEYKANKKYSNATAEEKATVPLQPGVLYSLWETVQNDSTFVPIGIDIAFRIGENGKPQLIAADDPVRAASETSKLFLYDGQNHTNGANVDTQKYWNVYDSLVNKGVISISNDGMRIVVKNFGKTTYKAIKSWMDSSVGTNWRPDKITLTLHAFNANNEETTIVYDKPKTVDVTAANKWQYEWTDLPKKDIYGNDVTYRVSEADVNWYATSYRYTNGSSTSSSSGELTWTTVENYSDLSSLNETPVRILVNNDKAVYVDVYGNVSLVDANNKAYYEGTLLKASFTGKASVGGDVVFKAVRSYRSGSYQYTNTYYLGSSTYSDTYRMVRSYTDSKEAGTFNAMPAYGKMGLRYTSYYGGTKTYYFDMEYTNPPYVKSAGSYTNTTNAVIQRAGTSTASAQGSAGITYITNTYNAQASVDFILRKRNATVEGDSHTLTPGTSALQGAVFHLYKVEKRDGVWQRSSGFDPIELTTDINGYARTQNLKTEGYFKLEEITPPSAYQKLGENQYVIFRIYKETEYGYTKYKIEKVKDNTGDSNVNSYIIRDYSENTTCHFDYSIEIGNVLASYRLPNTGGVGTVIFTVLGLILVVGAGVVLVVRRRQDR